MAVYTAEEITNWYLYGTPITPSDLLDESLIRAKDYKQPLFYDVNLYMQDVGRFASPAFFSVIKQFFTTSPDLVAGEYTKNELFQRFGITDIKEKAIFQLQSAYNDSQNDVVERSYIWETTAFMIDDRATFVVNPDGTRYIKNFAVTRYLNPDNPTENFDFKSDTGLSQYANAVLQPEIDPSQIGRTVVIDFIGARTVTDFTFQDYQYAVQNAVLPDPTLLVDLAVGLKPLLDEFWNDGTTRFLDEHNRPIIYLTTDSDVRYSDQLAQNLSSKMLPYYYKNGIAVVAGAGSDNISGTSLSDHLLGGTGNDLLFGDEGNDSLDGGADADKLDGGAGHDFKKVMSYE